MREKVSIRMRVRRRKKGFLLLDEIGRLVAMAGIVRS